MKYKNIPPILLIVIPSLIILPFLGQLVGIDALDNFLFRYIFYPSCICLPVVLVLNFFWALFAPWTAAELAEWNLRIKLCLIPFYAFTVLFGIGVMLAIPFLFILDGLLMLTTSVYGLRSLIRMQIEGEIKTGRFLLLFLCHFCFVADVAAAIICYKAREKI